MPHVTLCSCAVVPVVIVCVHCWPVELVDNNAIWRDRRKRRPTSLRRSATYSNIIIIMSAMSPSLTISAFSICLAFFNLSTRMIRRFFYSLVLPVVRRLAVQKRERYLRHLPKRTYTPTSTLIQPYTHNRHRTRYP